MCKDKAHIIIMHAYYTYVGFSINMCTCVPPGQLIFSRKSDCLGCAVLLCLVCLFDFACFFLSSLSSLI